MTLKLYEILNLDNNATQDDIKKAYKQLAIKYHPDKNKHKDTTEIFESISKAYDVLGNPDKRAAYDRLGDEDYEDTDEVNDPFEMFRDLFDTLDKVPDVDVMLELELEDLYYGCTVEKAFKRFTLCKKCRGKGTHDGYAHPCKDCYGNGSNIAQVIEDGEEVYVQIPCKVCDEKGIDPSVKLCKKCKGDTCYQEEVTVEVEIPAGAYQGYNVIVPNEGNEIPKAERDKLKGDKRSGVNFIVDETKHDKFKRGLVFPSLNRSSKADLMYELDINLSESLCGFDHKIRHIDGKKIHIRHKEAIVNGEYLVYKGKGMPIPKSNLMGDLFIKLKVEKPQISKKQRNKIYNILNDTKEDAPHIDKPSKNIVTFEDFESEQLAKSSS